MMGALGVGVAQAAQSGHANGITWALWLPLGVVVIVLGGAIWLVVASVFALWTTVTSAGTRPPRLSAAFS